MHFRFSFEPRFPEVDKSLFLAPPLRATSCNIHYSGSIWQWKTKRETWSKSKVYQRVYCTLSEKTQKFNHLQNYKCTSFSSITLIKTLRRGLNKDWTRHEYSILIIFRIAQTYYRLLYLVVANLTSIRHVLLFSLLALLIIQFEFPQKRNNRQLAC